MRRGLFFFVLFSALAFYGWDQGVTEGGIGRYIEGRPPFYQGDRILYVIGSFHEIMNQDQKALGMYQRIVTLYPKSRFGDDAQYGVAACYERLNNRRKALEEYQKYLEKYPQGRFHISVSRNITLLRGL